jgi:TonB family protein
VIKSLATGRISQLIGKVSIGATRSKNIVIATGVPAGSQPTGRALAAIGAINKSGKDWASEGKGTGVAISTKGKAGGVGLGSYGKLATGNTGAGGVGLIEEESEVVGGLDREVIANYIRSKLGQILYCYERQLSAQPDLYGKVAVKFTIGPTGGVEAQKISETTLANNNVENCILQKLADWKFPAPKGGTRVMVTYPFLFKSTR